MNVQHIDYDSPTAAEELVNSLKNTGFAIIGNHPIDSNKVDRVYQEWQRFFGSDNKIDYLFNEKTQDGYFPMDSESAKGADIADLKEFFHVYAWGKYPKELSHETLDLHAEMTCLASTLLGWIDQATPTAVKAGFSMPLPEMLNNSQHILLRILHYPPLSGDEPAGAVRAAAHEDINLITLLPAATAAGLQVQDTKGAWHDVPCDPGTIIVNAADMLQMASGGYYPSTCHRVMNPTGQLAKMSRLSMPLFLHPQADVKLSETHTAKQYLLERLRELGLVAD